MSVGGGMGGSKSTTNENSKVNPWEPTQPLLKEIIGDLGTIKDSTNLAPINQAINSATDYYKSGAGSAADVFKQVGGNLVNTPDRTGQIDSAYSDMQRRLSGTADGSNLDLSSNKYLQDMLAQVGTDAQERINAQFAGAGRDLSGRNNLEVGKGVAQAQLPLLLDQYNRELGRTDSAARDLYQAGASGAQTQTGMDVARGGLMKTGAELSQAGADIGGGALEKILGLSEMQAQLPYASMGWLTDLLYPAAGLGQQSEGTSSTKGSKWGFGVSSKLY